MVDILNDNLILSVWSKYFTFLMFIFGAAHIVRTVKFVSNLVWSATPWNSFPKQRDWNFWPVDNFTAKKRTKTTPNLLQNWPSSQYLESLGLFALLGIIARLGKKIAQLFATHFFTNSSCCGCSSCRWSCWWKSRNWFVFVIVF